MTRVCFCPQKLAFQYLEELASEFSRLYGTQVDSVARPYAFIKFGEPLHCTERQLKRRHACNNNQQGIGSELVQPRIATTVVSRMAMTGQDRAVFVAA